MSKLVLLNRVPTRYDPSFFKEIIGAICNQVNSLSEGQLQGRYYNASATPSATVVAAAQSDIVWNNAVSVMGSTGAQYVQLGWICTSPGNPGTFKELDVPIQAGPAYEASTFTPTFDFATVGDLSVSYSVQVGAYVKVGAAVFFTYALTWTPTYTTSSGNAQFNGLPYASQNVANQQFAVSVDSLGVNATWPGAATQAAAIITNNSSRIRLDALKSATAATTFSTTAFPSGSQQVIRMSGWYMTSS